MFIPPIFVTLPELFGCHTMITIYPHYSAVNEPRHIDIGIALQRIRTGHRHKHLIEQIREGNTDLKKQLPAYSFSGVFTARNDKSCIEHSGFICLDFDKTTKEEILQNSKYIYAAFLSPTGTGVKVLVRIPADISTHGARFDALREYFNHASFDPKTRDLSRLCFDSYDPDIYVNTDAPVFEGKLSVSSYNHTEKQPDLPITSHSRIYDNLRSWMERKGEHFTSGNRNNYVSKLAGACNRYGIPRDTCIALMTSLCDHDFTQTELETTIKSMYRYTEEHATAYFEDNHTRPYVQGRLQKGATDTEIVTELIGMQISQDSAVSVVRDVHSHLSNLTVFWTATKTRTSYTIAIHLQDFLSWLHKNGIYRYEINDGGKWILIRIMNNIVEVVDETYISHLVMTHLRSLPDTINDVPTTLVIEYFIRTSDKNYKPTILAHLNAKRIVWNRDDRHSAWFFFRNTAVKVTKSAIDLVPYTDIPHAVWKTQIIDREYTHIDNDDELMSGVFARFLALVASGSDNGDPAPFHKMIKITGFMMHGFKDRSQPGALILTDEKSQDRPEGGTGKGIYMAALRKFKRSAVFDGKAFNFDKSFLWQRVSQDTQIIYIEDVKRGFDFERLFSALTEGIEIERKNKDSFYLPYEISPKIAISTNYTLKGDGNSNERRRIEVEFKDFFNATNTPLDYFGHILFDDWDTRQWSLFDCFMVLCCQLYLANGIDRTLSDSMRLKHLRAETAQEFLEWADDYIKIGEFYAKSDLMAAFVREYGDFHWLKTRTFVQWLEKWSAYKNLTIVDRRTNTTRGMVFMK